MGKYILLIATAALLYVNNVMGQQDYKDVLMKTFLAFDTTQSLATKTEQSNKLTLIAKKYSNEWAPHYYAAYSKAQLAYMVEGDDKKDAFVDEAEREHSEALSILGKENDETHVLAAMIANARMAVKPQARWQKYGKIYEDNLAKAKELNPDNPRIYYLTGTSKFFTPKMFGGGKKAALPYFEKAQGLYAKEKSDDITKPFWGKEANGYFIKQCEGEDKE